MSLVDPGWHTNAALAELVGRCVARAGERAVQVTAGQTVEGRGIPAVRVAGPGRVPSLDRPQALITANIHGNEVIASEVALRVLDLLTQQDPPAAALRLLAAADVALLPAVNLDAREAAAGALARDRRGVRSRRQNARGVDLNRNFPYPGGVVDVWHPLAGTRVRWLPWYRGEGSLSEPEARAVASLAEDLRPRAAVALHSVGRKFLYPWCCRPEPPADLEAFLAMGRAFQAAQARPYVVQQSRSWYAILGDLDDWLHDRFRTRAVTVELSAPGVGVRRPSHLLSLLAWMNPSSPGPTVENAAVACLEALAVGVASLPEAVEAGPGTRP